MTRKNNRKYDELRTVKIINNYLDYPDGSILIEHGNTKIICSATVQQGVPSFREESGKGWLTAEYEMMPGSNRTRTPRASRKGKISGRTYEIQRLIGRSLRMALDFKKLGLNTIWLDCDVIQADGGTRTASITGAWIALKLAVDKLLRKGKISENPIISQIAAVSVGIVKGEMLLDLEYSEDSIADVDMNIVMTNENKFIEIQGTAENDPYDFEKFNKMVKIAEKGIFELFDVQKSLFV